MAKGFGISDLTSLGFGQVGQLLETMDMMSKTWSAMALPAAMSPTLSIEELDKRISDLRAIEQWLSLNQNMLRSTIQGLEVQRGTIATLRSFGTAMGTPEAGGQALDPDRLAALFAAMQFPAGHSRQSDAPPPAAGGHEPSAQSMAPGGPRPDDAAPAPAGQGGESTRDADGPAPMHADVAQLAQAWWNMLNEQFQQVTGAAIGNMAAASKAAEDATPPATDAPAPATGRRRRATATTSGGRKRAPRTT